MSLTQYRTFSSELCKLTVLVLIGFMVLSRFFSETLGVIPKVVDVINYPVFFVFIFLLIFGGKRSVSMPSNTLLLMVVLLFFSVLLSALLNPEYFYLPVVVLFLIGILEGPVLFLSLSRVIGADKFFVDKIERFFVILFLINVAAVFFVSYPQYILSGGNPDKLSGTFGNNAYYFSIFLVVIGGWYFGKSVVSAKSKAFLYVVMAFVFGTFFLLQYRAALPFFCLSFLLLGLFVFGKKIISFLATVSVFLVLALGVIGLLQSEFDNADRLKYGDWASIMENPLFFVQFGKFQAYPETINMYSDHIGALALGVGAGNYTSRAYYTFGYEYEAKDGKGVSKIIRDYLGQDRPRFTPYDSKYLQNYRSQVVFGSYQLSNPNSSYIAGLGELGLIGGGVLLVMYSWLLRLSYLNLKASLILTNALPVASAAFAGTVYVFLLAFLDNYWEMARATLPIWTLNWAAYASLKFQMRESMGIQK